jgi:hypothetical protein
LIHHSGIYDPFNDVVTIVDGNVTLLFRYEAAGGATTPGKTR